MKLIIAEKPSVAKSIASALGAASRADGFYEGNGLIVSWCLGHLVAPMDAEHYDDRFRKWRFEDLPILPEPFRYEALPDKREALQNLKWLMERPDVHSIINACDAGREGELIFRLVMEQTGCRKPVERLWISSMEDEAIREGFRNLRPGTEFDPLYQSALCRQKADWLVGINATRLFSVLYHRTLNVGRVQTPTLAMLTERAEKIRKFKKEPYYHVRLMLPGAEAVLDKILRHDNAETARMACQNETVICTSIATQIKKEPPPKLFDLTTLQREANRLLGYTAKQTLDYAQSLYEQKLLTYPRTDSKYLTTDMAETAVAVIHLAVKQLPFTQYDSFCPMVTDMISDKDVTDHHAIIPTMEIGRADILHLPGGERNLLLLVCCKLLCAAAEPYEYEATTVTFSCCGMTFTARGKRVLSQGWKEIDGIFRSTLKDKPMEEQERQLSLFVEGQTVPMENAFVTEYFTTPPKPYSEDTLLSAMETAGKEDLPEDAERKGLGTPATRAATIEKLISSGFVERKGKSLLPTDAGMKLITILPDTLTSPLLTAEWEQQLSAISKGEADAEAFMAGIATMVQDLIRNHSCVSEAGHKLFVEERKCIGNCPRCGNPVYEGQKNFACSDRACGFVLWKNDKFWTSRKKELTGKLAADLLKHGRTTVKSLWSEKKGKTYDATVILDDTGGQYINFKLEFPKKGDKSWNKKN